MRMAWKLSSAVCRCSVSRSYFWQQWTDSYASMASHREYTSSFATRNSQLHVYIRAQARTGARWRVARQLQDKPIWPSGKFRTAIELTFALLLETNVRLTVEALYFGPLYKRSVASNYRGRASSSARRRPAPFTCEHTSWALFLGLTWGLSGAYYLLSHVYVSSYISLSLRYHMLYL